MSCAAKHRSYGAGVCHSEREDYMECLHHTKLVSSILLRYVYRSSWGIIILYNKLLQAARLGAIQNQKEKLIREGKWPPNKQQ